MIGAGFLGPCSEDRCAVADSPLVDAPALVGTPMQTRCLECGLVGRRDAAFLRHCDSRGHRAFAQCTGHGLLLHCQRCSMTTYARDSAEAAGMWSLAPASSAPADPARGASLRSPGIANLGATCYMSSVLQLLLASAQVLHYACELQTQRCGIDQSAAQRLSSDADAAPPCIACELSALLCCPRSGIMVPSDLLYAIWCRCPSLANPQQQDAHEFLVTLLGGFDEHVLANHRLSAPSLPASRPLSSLFEGSLISEVTCTVCGHRCVGLIFRGTSTSVPGAPGASGSQK